MKITSGDSVIVKDGIKDPDSEDFEIGGWWKKRSKYPVRAGVN